MTQNYKCMLQYFHPTIIVPKTDKSSPPPVSFPNYRHCLWIMVLLLFFREKPGPSKSHKYLHKTRNQKIFYSIRSSVLLFCRFPFVRVFSLTTFGSFRGTPNLLFFQTIVLCILSFPFLYLSYHIWTIIIIGSTRLKRYLTYLCYQSYPTCWIFHLNSKCFLFLKDTVGTTRKKLYFRDYLRQYWYIYI